MNNRFTWKGGSGSLGDPPQWIDQTSGAPGPPTSADDADFLVATAGTLSGAGVARIALFDGGSTPWTLTGTLTAESLYVGQANTSSLTVSVGTISLSGGDATNTGFLGVGNRPGSQGSLTIDAGGTVMNAQAAQTSLTPNFLTNIGYQGTGTVTVRGFLYAGVNGLTLGLGTAASSGTLLVTQGGLVTTATFDSTLLSALAVGKVGTGAITVRDPSSTMIASGYANFGRGGTGHLVVENQGSFTGGSASPDFSLLIGGGGVALGGTGSSGSAWLYGGTADALVTTGGVLSSLYNLTVGSGGSTGALTVQSQGV